MDSAIGIGAQQTSTPRTVDTDAELTAIAVQCGEEHGFEYVEAEFSELSDFKVRWTRTWAQVSFEVSDYLRGAPESVVRSLLSTVFDRMNGDETPYPADVKGYLQDPAFRMAHRNEWLSRHHVIPDTDMGHRLYSAIGRLTVAGLIPRDMPADIVWGWCPASECAYRAGTASSVMHGLVVSDALRTARNGTLDYVVFRLYLMATIPIGEDRATRFYEMLDRYPVSERSTAERALTAKHLRP